MLLPANYCLLIFVQCGHTSQISRSLALFMLLAEVSEPFLPICCPPFSVARNSQVSQGDV